MFVYAFALGSFSVHLASLVMPFRSLRLSFSPTFRRYAAPHHYFVELPTPPLPFTRTAASGEIADDDLSLIVARVYYPRLRTLNTGYGYGYLHPGSRGLPSSILGDNETRVVGRWEGGKEGMGKLRGSMEESRVVELESSGSLSVVCSCTSGFVFTCPCTPTPWTPSTYAALCTPALAPSTFVAGWWLFVVWSLDLDQELEPLDPLSTSSSLRR